MQNNFTPSTEEDEIKKVCFGRPHLFLLGAGASRAAFPSGDKNGRKLPLMEDLIDILGLKSSLKNYGVDATGNFESIYSSLRGDERYKELVDEMEARIFEYFSNLKLPDTPTLYDHLVLSLRPKDLIATFNWDPFLYWSLCRNHNYAEMPHTLFLHGNVKVGYCMKDKAMGVLGQRCSTCKEPFAKTPLLYPVEKKDYAIDPFIDSCWSEVKKGLSDAYIFTIFGYSAPTTDVEAISLLKEGWGSPSKRELEEVEIIDIKKRDELEEKWEPFIHSHHSRTASSFYDSFLARHPRRSCEAMWECLMECNPYPDRAFPKDAPFDELWDWFKPLVEVERVAATKRQQ